MNDSLRSWFDAQHWREITRVSVVDSPHTPYLAAAAYLAVLAFPDDTDKRDRLVNAFRAYLRNRLGMRAQIRWRDVSRALNGGSRQLNTRFRAAEFAAQVMLEKASSSGMTIEAARSIREAISREGKPMTFELPVDVLPANVRAGLKRRPQQQRDPRPGASDVDTNIFRDVWSPSKPVLHFAHLLHQIQKSRSEFQTIADFIVHPSWAPKAIDNLPVVAMGLCQTGITNPSELIMMRPQ